MYEELDDEIQKEMKRNFDELEGIIENLNHIVDEDTKAFSKVMEAFKLPKETEEEKAKRSAAIQEGYKVALEVPLRCAEECFKVLELQKIFAEYGNVNAITDVGVGGALLAATGLEGALFNVTINLLSIKDIEYRNKIEKKGRPIVKRGNPVKRGFIKNCIWGGD